MRTIGRIAYWIAAISLLAVILVSLDYTLVQSILISLIFCPCALLLEVLMPHASKPSDKVYLSLAVLVAVVLLILVLHNFMWSSLTWDGYFGVPVAPMLVNPVFLALVLTALSIGDFFWARFLAARYRPKARSITFFSDRRSVTLLLSDIAYIESNDIEVRIVTASGPSYRNKTGISQWENLLGDGFLRIHRSYLVNIGRAIPSAHDQISVCGRSLPVSRKYRDVVRRVFGNKSLLGNV